eukprot:CAMPEP_0172555216 /NCGR_PEP_ID=MMETSP1067-20121228/58303_1 /TAXON_ID=265564 ORGANISM="Thalassiosira punctigera, Strain Tpunct2005C2" /NCGR_SAMPLE_ID=MMETSP1067 /ASSEMBLY_ACC=CAM_ASM_000444 /LENGTH=485 /DNA_ID=CAMNT_0013343729 /DNA_START=44 /DNA_END=1501 /DNA_ORIENTATION=+
MAMASAPHPRSALATLTIPSSTLSSDPLLALIATIAPPHQTKVTISKKKNELLSLTIGPDTMTHRNAILRSMCGVGLHNAMDSLGSSPILFLGGHSASSFAGASPVSSLAMAGISSWMSVASSVREGGVDDVASLINQLNGYFTTRSFVVPSAAPTLADLDLYLAIVSKVSGEALESMAGSSVNTRRWLEQCGATVEGLVVAAAKNAEYSKIHASKIPMGLNPKPRPLPIFFYGDEDESVVAAAASAVASATAPAAKKVKGAGAKPEKSSGRGGGGGEITDEQKKAAAEKRAKKAAEKAAKKKDQPKANKGGGAPAAELNVSALDIRVGRIVKAWEHESSEKLYCEEVDVGEESGPRKIASGLRSFYKLDEMQNRTVLVLCNLKARNLAGFPSHGMVLCASNADHTSVEFAVPPEGAKIGERITFEGYEGEPEPENKVAKKKIFDKLAPDLKTDVAGEVVWKGVKGMTSAGVCKAVNSMTNAQVS